MLETGEAKIRKGLLYLEWTIASGALIILTVSVVLQVLTRYVLHISLSWPEELARFSCIWTVLIGASIAMERGKLHDVDIVFKYFPERVKPFIALGVNLLIFVLLSILVIHGVELTAMVHTQISPTLEIRMSYVYSAIPVASGLMLMSLLFDTIKKVTQLSLLKNESKDS